MACCSSRCSIFFILSLQLLATFERTVFDGLGQLWGLVIIDGLNIIFVIMAIIAVSRFASKAVVVVSQSQTTAGSPPLALLLALGQNYTVGAADFHAFHLGLCLFSTQSGALSGSR
eukprot:m.25094 g.25094  ORF g.25094 m.25094 type:complete len:116 (+) comp28735_c0_seq2:103-450(+)